MRIKKIELHGFKSFPKRTTITFHPGVTAIVGPNGCGKSNIVDGILWALGESRIKFLRTEKSEDVIFNGSEKKDPMGMAEVSITLSEDSKEEILTLSRLFYRSGESEYKMGEKKVRLKDIQEELWKLGIAGKEYFVIEQGAIGSLVNLKPQEKRALIEEAAEISKYKERKKEAKSKLIDSEQNLNRIEDLIVETERQKNSLQRQVYSARKYKELRERIRDLSLIYYELKSSDLMKEIENSRRKIELYIEKETEIHAELKSREKSYFDLKSLIFKNENELKEIQNDYYEKKSRMERGISQVEKESKRKSYLEENIKKYEENINELNKEREVIVMEIFNSEEEKRGNEESLKIKSIEAEALEDKLKQNSERLVVVKEELENLKKENLIKFSEHSSIKNTLTAYRKEFENIIKQKEKLYEEIKTINESEISLNLQRINHAIENLKIQKKKVLEKIKNLEEKKNEILEIFKIKQNELEEKRIKKSEISMRVDFLSSTVKEKINESALYSSGRMIDFLDLEARYYAPVENLLKDELSAYLMKNVPEGKKWLSSENVKGAFIFPRKSEEVIIPDNIKEDKAFITVLMIKLKEIDEEFSFPNAIVVEKIEDAFRLWEKWPDFNYVTLKGDILLSHGLLKKREKEDVLSFRLEVKNLNNTLVNLNEEIDSLENEIGSMEFNVLDIEKELNTLNEDLKNLEKLSLEAEFKHNTELNNKRKNLQRLETLKIEVELIEKEQNELNEKIDHSEKSLIYFENALGDSTDNISKKEKEIDEMEKEIREIQDELSKRKGEKILLSERILSSKRRISEFSKRLSGINEKIQHINSDVEKNKLEIEQADQIIRSFEKEIEGLEHITQKLKDDISSGEKNLFELKNRAQEVEKEINKLREKLEIARQERSQEEIRKAQYERDWVNLEEMAWKETALNLKEITGKSSKTYEGSIEELHEELKKSKESLEKFGAVNLLAEDEMKSVKERLNFLKKQREDILQSIESTNHAIKRIDAESRELLNQTIQKIRDNFKLTFSTFFEGGEADLKVIDEENLLESGIEIWAQPPGKKLQSLMLLSGGEKALASLAFLFALFLCRPTPFCIFDEVDAALDDANLIRYLNFIEKMKNDTQFIIITHNLKTMEKADYLYGITMDEPGESTIYSIRLDMENKNPQKLLKS
ncbi:MAG: chromosome segregation protein SMC [Acidobacteriota bacterium]